MSASADAVPMFPAFRRDVRSGLVVTAGIAALDPLTMIPLHDEFDTQAQWVLDRLDTVLGEAGCNRRNVLRLECFLADRGWFNQWNNHFAARFGDSPPARSTLVCTLPAAGLLLEIQAIAAVEDLH